MFHSGDDIGAIVADIGSQNARVGFAGDDYPKSFIPTVGTLRLFTVDFPFCLTLFYVVYRSSEWFE